MTSIYWPALLLAALCIGCAGWILYRHLKDSNLL